MNIKKKNKKILLISIILSIIFLPWFVNEIIKSKTIVTVAQNNDWIGFFASYLGGIISGLFTFLGVYLTLDSQKQKEEYEKKLQIKRLLMQLEFTYERIEAIDDSITVQCDNLIYDINWYNRLIFLEDKLDYEKMRNIIDWLSLMKTLENETQINYNGTKQGAYGYLYDNNIYINIAKNQKEKIKEIIEYLQ